MSGYGESHLDLHRLPDDTQFLAKPFSLDSLMHCLSEARQRCPAAGR
jgi:hypothetical protein